MLNDIQKSILQTVSDMVSIPDGAVNIRLDGQKEFRQNSEHIQIVSKTDKDGIDIRIAPFTKSENVHIPVILSKSGFHDLVYNDFFVGEGADVTIVAQRPKLAGWIPQMRKNLADALGTDAVNVKATTTERLGFEGEQLGISAQAVALLEEV